MAQINCIFSLKETATKYRDREYTILPPPLTLVNKLVFNLFQHNQIPSIRNYFQYEANLYCLYRNSARYRKQNRILN